MSEQKPRLLSGGAFSFPRFGYDSGINASKGNGETSLPRRSEKYITDCVWS